MRTRRPNNPLHPAMLLALSITLCGGSLWTADQPGGGTALPQRLADRANELTVGQRESVAQLLRFLADAAKELQQHDGNAIATTDRTTIRITVADAAIFPYADVMPPPVRLVAPHLLDLPPPATTA